MRPANLMVWPKQCTKNTMTNVYKLACYVKSLFLKKLEDMAAFLGKKI